MSEQFNTVNEQLAKLTVLLATSTKVGQTSPSESSIDSLSQKIEAQKKTIQELLQRNQKVDEKLVKCEVKMNQFDEMKSTIQELKQRDQEANLRLDKSEIKMNQIDGLKSTIQEMNQNEHTVVERQENYELRSSKKIDAMADRVDKFASVVDTFATNSVNSKMMCVDNSQKIAVLTSRLTEGEEQLTISKTSIAENSDKIAAVTNRLEPLESFQTKGNEQLEDLTTKQRELQRVANAHLGEIKEKIEQAGTQPSTESIVFSCYRTTVFAPTSNSGLPIPVPYSGCDVDTTDGAMDIGTGKFKAKKAGIYRLHFHASIESNAKAYAYIKKGSTTLTLFGQDKAQYYRSISGSVTTSLQAGEEVYVMIDGGNILYSSREKYIVFEGFLLTSL